MDCEVNIGGTDRIDKIAVMGGTFDPIHCGHLIAAETVRTRFGFNSILFIPSCSPPHKKGISISDEEHRYAMVQMATVTNPFFQVSRIELDRGGNTYTIDTIRQLKTILGSTAEIYFITGADAILEISAWKDVSELMSICKFIAVTRPGYDRGMLTEKVENLKSIYKSEIIIADIPSYAVSSTEIRKRVLSGESIKYLVPESVECYIRKNNLYGGAEKQA